MAQRAQAAMEFLMTYGWAMLVVLAAIAALAYFGVLSPDLFLPDRCSLPSGSTCLDSTVSATTAEVSFQNAFGLDMTNVSLEIDGCGTSSTVASLLNGQQTRFTIMCSPALTAGARFKGELRLTYTNTDTGLAHTLLGELIKKVE